MSTTFTSMSPYALGTDSTRRYVEGLLGQDTRLGDSEGWNQAFPDCAQTRSQLFYLYKGSPLGASVRIPRKVDFSVLAAPKGRERSRCLL